MGCFIGCFGGSKDRKRRKRRNKVIPRDQRCGSQKPLQSTVCLEKEQEFAVKPTKFVSDLQDKPEEQLGSSPRKRVTFDTNVRTYEPVPINESSESLLNGERIVEREDDSIGSYPANHRYQNSGDSDDDELEETEYDDSDLDDGEDDENQDYEEFDDDYDAGIVVQKVWSESIPTESIESRTEFSSLNSNRNARDRSLYVHPVLNPVENLTQWRAVKSKPAAAPPPVKNYRAAGEEEQQQEPCISFSSEPIFKPKSNKPKNSIQEIAVDASLSNWLLSSPQTTTRTTTTPKQQKATIFTEFCETANSGSQFSLGSNSGLSFEDRPILGALTIEELKQFSASNSPRKSPRRRIPDEMPIIGTVGSYWNETESSMDSGSVSSYKGMPNTVRCF